MIDNLMELGDVAGAAAHAQTVLDNLGQVASETTPIAEQNDPSHLEESAQLVAAAAAARELEAGGDPEGEADDALQEVQVQKAPLDIGRAQERGAGWRAPRVLSAGDATQEYFSGATGQSCWQAVISARLHD